MNAFPTRPARHHSLRPSGRLVLLGLCALCVLSTANAFGDEGPPALRTETFDTPAGKLTVYLPGDVRAGDTLSGTVVAEPSGKSDAERQRSLATLEGYVLDSGDEGASGGGKVESGRLRWSLGAAAAALDLMLKDSRGKTLARRSVPVVSTPLDPPTDFAPPGIGQTGRPIVIPGPFDGDFGDTAVNVGGAPAKLLAESPRGLIFEAPADVEGATSLHLTEGDRQVESPYRNVAVQLSAGSTSLKRGERTTMKVEVRGLEGLEEPIPLRIVNRSPSVVTLEGGTEQDFEIRPADVGTGGVYRIERELTGLTLGPFRINADLVLPGAGPLFQAAPGARPNEENFLRWDDTIIWGPWNLDRDGRCWRKGDLERRPHGPFTGKGKNDSTAKKGTAFEEFHSGKGVPTKKKANPDEYCKKKALIKEITRTLRYPHPGGGGRVVEEKLKKGKVTSTTEAEYNAQGNLKQVTEKKGDTTTTKYENGEAKAIERKDKNGTTKDEWKKEEGKWYQKKGNRWVQDRNPPVPDPAKLPKLE